MEVMEAIRARRSIRKFRPDSLPEEHLNKVLEAARLAPSAGNRQPITLWRRSRESHVWDYRE